MRARPSPTSRAVTQRYSAPSPTRFAIPDVTIRSTDLALGNRKFAGHAQRRLRHTLLHHGTILYGFDLGLINTLLPEPPRRPAWRGSRRHREFLATAPLGRADLVARLMHLPAALAG